MRFVYWDSDAFLGVLMNEPDKAPGCKKVIEEAKSGKLTIVTSTLTLAEVLWIRGKPRVPPDRNQVVSDLFAHEWIALRELDRHIAESARGLVWEENVRPRDAIHVASALDARVGELNTFDGQLLGLDGRVGNPPLTIRKPDIEGRLL